MKAADLTDNMSPVDPFPQSGRFQQFEGLTVDHQTGDRAVKRWFFLAVLWFAVFTTFGLLLAVKFFFPTFLGGASWLTFGVLRPAHVNGVLFGFVSSGLLGAMFYIVPRLCAVNLFKPRLAAAIPILWNAAVLTGIVWILFGGSQGREYAELPWAVDVAVMVTLILMAVVILGTMARRTEKKLYVSLWYYAGTMLWFPIVYFIGNVMWHPATGALNGIQDAMFNWYYGHNVLGLWFTTLGIPAIYYAVPRIIKRPLYSHLLSLISFFSIAFFYTGVGAHHLLQAPIPEWVKTIAVVMTVLMLVPVLAFATNIVLTLRGSGGRVLQNPILMFILFGFACYVLASVQGSMQACAWPTSICIFHSGRWATRIWLFWAASDSLPPVWHCGSFPHFEVARLQHQPAQNELLDRGRRIRSVLSRHDDHRPDRQCKLVGTHQRRGDAAHAPHPVHRQGDQRRHRRSGRLYGSRQRSGHGLLQGQGAAARRTP
jgi:cbb3-type cytochrome c oxidase subunit I